MNKLFKGFCKQFTMNSSQIDAELFFSIMRNMNSQSERKEEIKKYLRKHFDQENVQKVQDFPSNSQWLNVAEPLSLHHDLKGKVVLLDFFTYCCINCMHVLPDLKILEKKFSVENGLVIIGVHCAKFTNEKETKNIASAIKRYDINHAVINDSEGTVWNAFDVHCWPTFVLVGPRADVLLNLSGEGHLELLNFLIENTLDVMKETNLLSTHSLPQIRLTNELKSFRILSFPGKITSYCTKHVTLLGIADTGHNRILITDASGRLQHTVGGFYSGFKDGNFSTSRFNAPQGLVFKNENILYVADTENHAIREIDLVKNVVKTVAGTGKQGSDRIGGNLWNLQEISSPWDICFGKNTNVLLIAMAGYHQIWALYLSEKDQCLFKKGKEGECKSIAGTGREENRNNNYPHASAFSQPSGLAYCSERNSVFIADSESSSIRELNLDSGKVCAVVGGDRNPLNLFAFGDEDGVGYDVKLQHVLGVAWHDGLKLLYVADSYNHKIKIVDVYKKTCSTINLNTKLNEPGGLCVTGDQILIADTNNHCIKSYHTKTSKVSELSIEISKSQYPEIIDAEETVEIAKNGGKMNVNIVLNKSSDLSLTEGAPAFWSISFADEHFKALPGYDTREDLQLKSNLSISIPESLNRSSFKILIKGVMYVCKESSCSMLNLLFVIHVYYTNQTSKDVSCEFIHTLIK